MNEKEQREEQKFITEYECVRTSRLKQWQDNLVKENSNVLNIEVLLTNEK